MPQMMLGAADDKLKIFGAIIRLVVILVMNLLFGLQSPPQLSLHHKSMFVSPGFSLYGKMVAVSHVNKDVTVCSYVFTTLVG